MRIETDGITLTDEISVLCAQTCGTDAEIICAAKASVDPEESIRVREDLKVNPEKTKEYEGLVNYLMSSRHGSVFEMGWIQHVVTAPIFIWREHHRHRIGWSFSEQSARYRPLKPVFWIPSNKRKLIPVPDPGPQCLNPLSLPDGSEQACGGLLIKVKGGHKRCEACSKEYFYHVSARPLFQEAGPGETEEVRNGFARVHRVAFTEYERQLSKGVAAEVARSVLGTGIYSTCWTACNPRSMMNFLSLRTHEPTARYVSRPQAEIEQVAREYEKVFAENWPITHAAFVKNGRVAP